jgi:hypothetical protein
MISVWLSRIWQSFSLITDVMFFRERGMILLDAMFDYHPVHLMALFLNPRTRKMKQCTNNQRNSCIEYIKQEMILFDAVNDLIQSNDDNSTSIRRTTHTNDRTLRIMEIYYDEEEEEGDVPTSTAAIHQAEIDNYFKFGMDKSKQSDVSVDSSTHEREYNPLDFWRQNYSLYPHLARIAKRVFAVPATSAAVEREFSLAGNIITKKRSRLSPETVNDIIFLNSFERYKKNQIQMK